MSKTFASLVAVMTFAGTAATAAAESYDATQPVKPSAGYLGVGGSLGVQRAIVGGMFIDGGKRLGASPLFLRGQLTGGKSGSEGSYVQIRAGVEARGCIFRDLVCALAGADTGYQRDHVIDDGLFGDHMEVDAHDVIVVPRAGLEAGGKIRLRTTIELPLYQRIDGSDTGEESRGTGLAVSFAVAGMF